MKIRINNDLCKKDGLCARVCPAGIFVQPETLAIPEVIDENRCIACGQCAAICPQEAITHIDFPPGRIQPTHFEWMPSSLQVTELLRTRRSIRSFQNRAVDKELIEKIIEAAQFAPSGHNSQSTQYTVVQDQCRLNQIVELTIEYLRFEVRRFSSPFFRGMVKLSSRELAESGIREIMGFNRLIESYETGKDPILFNAKTLLVLHANRHTHFGDVNASLALQNAALMAHALGIGHFYTGFIIAACRAPLAPQWAKKFSKLLGLSPHNTIFGAMALGYPIPKFKNWIEKKTPQTVWL